MNITLPLTAANCNFNVKRIKVHFTKRHASIRDFSMKRVRTRLKSYFHRVSMRFITQLVSLLKYPYEQYMIITAQQNPFV
jgi:hypothetical protein